MVEGYNLPPFYFLFLVGKLSNSLLFRGFKNNMCICLNESAASNTHVYVGNGIRDGHNVHVLAYQCTASALDPSGKGAMLIPIPSTSRLTGDNFIDTSDFPKFLKDISNASKRASSRSMMKGFSFSAQRGAMIVERGNTIYVYADNFASAAAALDQVREDCRPNFTSEFIEGCSALYQDPITIACWAGNVEMDPLLLWYVPSDASTFRLPTMDAHDGKAPNPEAMVDTDHILSVSAGDKIGHRVSYSDDIPDAVCGLLPNRVHGTDMRSHLRNGDMFVNVADTLTKQHPEIRRATSVDSKPSVRGTLDGWEG